MQSMSLIQHLEELRRRVAWAMGFYLVGLMIAFIERSFFMKIVTYPHDWAMKSLGMAPSLYVFSYQDNFISQFKICMVVGFVLSFPMILYHALQFVMAGLFPKERKQLLYMYLPSSLMLFISGALFSFFLIIPYGLKFLVTFGTEAGLHPNIGFNSYVTLFVILIVVSGLMFELPLVMALLARIGFVSSLAFRQKRRHAVLAIFVLSAIVTPTPDPLTLLLLAGPLILLYELGCLISGMIERKLEENQSTISITDLNPLAK